MIIIVDFVVCKQQIRYFCAIEEEPYLLGRPIGGTAVSHWWDTGIPLVGHGFATGGKNATQPAVSDIFSL